MGLFDRPSSVNFKDDSAKFQESLQESLVKELQEAKDKELGSEGSKLKIYYELLIRII